MSGTSFVPGITTKHRQRLVAPIHDARCPCVEAGVISAAVGGDRKQVVGRAGRVAVAGAAFARVLNSSRRVHGRPYSSGGAGSSVERAG